MKLIRQIAIVYTFVMLLALLAFLYLNRVFSFSERDLPRYNEMLHKVESDLAAGASEEIVEKRYRCDIVLSTEIEDPELAELYRDSALVLDLTQNGEYIGKVAWADELDRYNIARKGFFGMSVIVWVLTLIAGYMLLIYFYIYLIRPIKELRNFSEEIAKGNLDIALPIHQHNVFGEFVEAFDQMREQLIESKKREIEAEKARKELVMELSHDIKTPVAVIKATCEVMEVKANQPDSDGEGGGMSGQEIMDKVSTISQKADTISLLVSNLMHANLEDMERIEVKTTEESSVLIKEFFGTLKQYGRIILENDIPGCLVYMDRLRLEQAIDNVVGNSYKYAGTDIHVSFDTFIVDLPPEGEASGREGEASGRPFLKKAEFLRIRIKDDGPGVSDDDLPLVVEKYYRGRNSGGRTGSGLGLFLVKYYMEKMRGGMEYYNDKGFVVELLLRKV